MSTPARPALTGRLSFAQRLDRRTHLLLIVPGLVLLALIVVYPVVYNVANSFTNLNLSFPVTSWVGLDNYARVIADPAFYAAIGRTLVWTIASVAGQLLLGFVAAVALQNLRRGQTAFRVGLIIPWAFPSIVLAFSWKFMLDPMYGVVNDVLMRLGLITEPIAFLGNASHRHAVADRDEHLVRLPVHDGRAARGPAVHPDRAVRVGQGRWRGILG